MTFIESSARTPIFSFSVTIRGGTVLDPTGHEGLSYHCMELMRRGCKDWSRDRIDRELDRMGGSLSLACSRDATHLSGLCLSRYIGEIEELICSLISSPLFESVESKKLVAETQSEISEMRDDDSDLARRHFRGFLAKGHPYGRTSLGTKATLERIETSSEIHTHYQKIMTADQPIIGIAGDISVTRAEEFANRITGTIASLSIPDQTALLPSGSPIPTGQRRLMLIDKPSRTQCQILLGQPAPRYGTDDFARILVAETAFGGMFSSRLMQEIRVENGWSYGCGSLLGKARGPLWLQIDLAPSKEVAVRALKHTLKMYEDFVEKGVSEDEIQMAKKYLHGSLVFSRETVRQRMYSSVQLESYGLSQDYPDRLLEKIESFSLEEINETLRTKLNSRDVAIVLVATASDIQDELGAVVANHRVTSWLDPPSW